MATLSPARCQLTLTPRATAIELSLFDYLRLRCFDARHYRPTLRVLYDTRCYAMRQRARARRAIMRDDFAIFAAADDTLRDHVSPAVSRYYYHYARG